MAAALAAKKQLAEPLSLPRKRQPSGLGPSDGPLVAGAEGRRVKRKRQRVVAGVPSGAAAAAAAGERRELGQPRPQQPAAARQQQRAGQQARPVAAGPAAAAAPAGAAAGGARLAAAAARAAVAAAAPAAGAGAAPAAADRAAAAGAAARVPAPAAAAPAARAEPHGGAQPPGGGRGPAPQLEAHTAPWVAARLEGASTGAMQLAQDLTSLAVWAGVPPAQVHWRCCGTVSRSQACMVADAWRKCMLRRLLACVADARPPVLPTPAHPPACLPEPGATCRCHAERRLWRRVCGAAAGGSHAVVQEAAQGGRPAGVWLCVTKLFGVEMRHMVSAPCTWLFQLMHSKPTTSHPNVSLRCGQDAAMVWQLTVGDGAPRGVGAA